RGLLPMSGITSPRKPVANWEQERDAWVAAVQELVAQAEAWSHQKNWSVFRDQKEIREDRIGSYHVPVLTIQSAQGRLMLNPIARFIVGAKGRVDLDVFPSYDSVPIIRTDGGWQFKSDDRPELDQPWAEDSFTRIAAELMSSA